MVVLDIVKKNRCSAAETWQSTRCSAAETWQSTEGAGSNKSLQRPDASCRVSKEKVKEKCGCRNPGRAETPKAGVQAAKEMGKGIVHHNPVSVLKKAERPKESKSALGACEKSGWKMISIAVDSGACDNVIGPNELPEYEDMIRETPASKAGDDFVSASGDVIPNYGELKVMMVTREQTTRGMTFQAAGVAKPLGSVKRMLQTGHRVVFDEGGSYIENKRTGEINWMREEDGNFMLDVYIPPLAVARAAGFHGQP